MIYIQLSHITSNLYFPSRNTIPRFLVLPDVAALRAEDLYATSRVVWPLSQDRDDRFVQVTRIIFFHIGLNLDISIFDV